MSATNGRAPSVSSAPVALERLADPPVLDESRQRGAVELGVLDQFDCVENFT